MTLYIIQHGLNEERGISLVLIKVAYQSTNMLKEGLAIPGPMRNENKNEMNFPIQWIKLSMKLFNALFLVGVIGIGKSLRMKE